MGECVKINLIYKFLVICFISIFFVGFIWCLRNFIYSYVNYCFSFICFVDNFLKYEENLFYEKCVRDCK